MILLIAAVDALVTAVLVVQVVLTAAGATGTTGRVRRQLRRDRRQGRRGGHAAMRRQRRDRRIPQEAMGLVYVLPTHHVPLEIFHRVHSDTGCSIGWMTTCQFDSFTTGARLTPASIAILVTNTKF